MQQEHNRKRIYFIKQMLFAMADGNFNMRIPLSGHDDELEALVVLINMVTEEFRDAIFHQGYINPHQSYVYLAQAMVALNADGHIQMSNKEFRSLIGYSDQELREHPITDFLTPETSHLFEHTLIALNQPGDSQQVLDLELISKKGLRVFMHCSLAKFKEQSQITLSFIVPVVHELHLHEYFNDTLIKQRINRQADAVLIQEIYDYILENLEEPLPKLKTLARKFGTNEFKLKSGFRQFFNTSVYSFYNDERLKRAHTMISQRDLPLKEIALLTGFSTYPNFSKAFKKKYGYNPTDLLRNEINKDSPNE